MTTALSLDASPTVPLAFVSNPENFFDGDWVESKDQDPAGEVRLLQLADIGVGRFLDKSDRHVNQEAFERLACREVVPGDVLIARMPDPIARACVVPGGLGRTITVVDVAVVRADQDKLVPGYLTYVLNSEWFRSLIESLQDGSTRQRISRSRLGQQRIPLPPLDTQKRIADYLDRETGEIDAMLAKMDELTQTLEERRTEVIQTTLSALPERANVALLADTVSGSGFPDRFQGITDAELPFYKVSSLSGARRGVLHEAENTVTAETAAALGARVVPVGSVVMAKIGAALLLARFARTSLPCCIDNNMQALVPRAEVITGRFLAYAMETVSVQSLVKPGPVPTIDVMGLKMTHVPFSRDIEEQTRIADHLDEVTGKIDQMLAKTAELKNLLIERRAALITDVVTGKKQVL